MGFSRSWPIVLATLLFACSSGPRGSVEIELAPSTACGQPSESIDAEWECMRIQVCPVASRGGPTDAGPPLDAPLDAGPPRDAGTTGSGCALITHPGGDHASATDELVVDRVTLTSFDAQLDPDREYQVIVTAYDASGEPVAIGRTPAVSPLGGPVRVRLHRYGETAPSSSCAGVNDPPREDGELRVAHRALGAAVSLASGNVLFFGGFTGNSIRGQGLMSDSRYQPRVDVYDVAASRFHPVTVDNQADPMAPAGFLRVLFEARHIGTDPDGRDRIRVFGGFTSSSLTAVPLRFDGTLRSSIHSVPLLPSTETSPAPVVDLLYDEANRTLTVVSVQAIPEPVRTGVAAVSEVVDGRTIVAGGISSHGGPTSGDRDMVRPIVESDWFVWTASELARRNEIAAMPTAAYQRFGATVTHLGGTEFLVWGGNLTVPETESYLGYSGILLNAPVDGGPGTATAVPTVTMMGITAGPVAFHTATALGGGRVLVTGGLAVTSSLIPAMSGMMSVTPMGIGPTRPTPPGFTVLVREAGAFRSADVGGDVRAPSIFHQVTPLVEVGGRPTVLLVTGGAVIRDGLTLRGTDEVGLVTGAGDVWSYDALTTLRSRRWGHSTTVLPNGLVLVVGGYDGTLDTTLTLTPALDAEVLLVDDLLGVPRPDPVRCDDAGVAPPRDAGPGDAPLDVPPADAPEGDAPEDDAGM